MPEITVTLTPELHAALMRAAEFAELTANAHADMLDAHAPATARERRELGKAFAAARLRLYHAGVLARLPAIAPTASTPIDNA